MISVVDLLDRPYRDLQLLPELAGAQLLEPEELDHMSVSEFIDLGLAVSMNDHVTIDQVALYSGAEGQYSAYLGSLPRGLKFLMTVEEVHGLLGFPDRRTGPQKVPVLGLMRPWDGYVYDGYRMKINYSLESGFFVSIQLGKADLFTAIHP